MEKSITQEQFYKIIEKDKSRFIKPYMVNWAYMDKAQRRKLAIAEGQPENFFEYNGKDDLVKWFNWLQLDAPDYFGSNLTQNLINESLETDKKVFEKLQLKYDFKWYHKNIGLDNAIDYLFPEIYPKPERYKIKSVVDFGAGYGRQANLWTKPGENNIYIAVDAIAKSYCLQNLYFNNLERNFNEYVHNPDTFSVNFSIPGIYHLPTWRFDLIPDNSIDLVIAVQVLPELSNALVTKVIEEFYRILKPGGMLYVRDHKERWIPAGKINKEKLLKKNNFFKEFEAYIADDIDLHGIPRIWRKQDKIIEDSQKRKFNEFVWQILTDADSLTGGMLNKFNKKFKVKKVE